MDSDELSKRAGEFLGALSLSGSTFSISGSLTDRREFWTRRKTASFRRYCDVNVLSSFQTIKSSLSLLTQDVMVYLFYIQILLVIFNIVFLCFRKKKKKRAS